MNRSKSWFPGFLRLGFIIFIPLMLILFLTPQYVYSADVTLAWDAVLGCDDLSGYRIYKTNQKGLYTYGQKSDHIVWRGKDTTCTVSIDNEECWFVATAFDRAGNESGPSNEQYWRLSDNISGEGNSSVSIPSWTDYWLTLTMGSDDDDAIGVMFRYHDNDNYYRFSWDSQLGYRRLVKCENGKFVLLAEDSEPYVPGESYQIEVVADGTTLEIWVDGSPIFYVEDDSISEGTIALYSWANNGSYFDDVYVEQLGTGTMLMSEGFDDGDLSDWTIVDEGKRDDPSAWSAATGTLVQSSDIYSTPTNAGDLTKVGTYALYRN